MMNSIYNYIKILEDRIDKLEQKRLELYEKKNLIEIFSDGGKFYLSFSKILEPKVEYYNYLVKNELKTIEEDKVYIKI